MNITGGKGTGQAPDARLLRKVTSIILQRNTEDQLGFTWDSGIDDGGDNNTPYAIIGQVQINDGVWEEITNGPWVPVDGVGSYQNNLFPDGTTIKVRLRRVNVWPNPTLFSYWAYSNLLTVPPLRPVTNLVLTQSFIDSVLFTWDAGVENFSGENEYHLEMEASVSGGPWLETDESVDLPASNSVSNEQFDENLEPGQTVQVRIRRIHDGFNPSEWTFSNIITIPDYRPVTNVVASTGALDRVDFTWDPGVEVAGDNSESYAIVGDYLKDGSFSWIPLDDVPSYPPLDGAGAQTAMWATMQIRLRRTDYPEQRFFSEYAYSKVAINDS